MSKSKTITIELTEEELSYVRDALYAHKRSQKNYLLWIADTIDQDRFKELSKGINDRYTQLLEKIIR